jgi:hypothetical protein
MRLTGTALDCYKYLEPLYYDYRKIKRQSRQGGNFIITLISYNLKQRIHACSKTEIKRQSRQGGNFIIKLISYNLKQRIHACSKTEIKRQSRQGGNFIIKLISYNLKQRIHACSKRGKKPIQNNFRNRLIHYPETINVNEYIFMHPPYIHTLFLAKMSFLHDSVENSPLSTLKTCPPLSGKLMFLC